MKDHRPRTHFRLVLLTLLLMGGVVRAQDVLYWTGGDGGWSDARMWSATPDGAGGAGVPDERTDVHIGGERAAHVRVERPEACRSLHVDARHARVRVDGGAEARLAIAGGWVMAGDAGMKVQGGVQLTGRAGDAVIDLHGVEVGSDVVLDGPGNWDLMSALAIDAAHALRLERGELHLHGGVLKSGTLVVGPKAERGLKADGATVLVDALEGAGAPRVAWQPSTALLVSGVARRWDGTAVGQEELMRMAVNCGTGAGQTPFQVNPAVTSDYNGFGVSCNGVCDAAVNVSIQGGIGPFAIQWQGGPNGTGTSLPWVNTCAGNKLVIVTDLGQNVGCFASILVTPPPPLGVVFFGLNPPACANVCNGTAITFPGGGTGFGYQYDWNNGAETVPNPTQLCAGVNSLEIIDANGCVFDTTFTITLLPLAATLQSTPPNCAGDCDGTAEVTVTGGTPGYTYDWEPGSPAGDGTPQVTGLCAGSYTVLVADVNGCDTLIAFNLVAPPAIVPNLATTPASCADACDGTATATPTGAVGPFTFQWTPAPGSGQGTGTATGLCAGNGTVLITDQATGCDTLVSFTIASPPPLLAALTSANATCANSCDGSAGVVVSGGTPGYTYTWTPAPGTGQGTPNATGLCAGAYSLLVADAAGCDTLIAFTITAPPPFTIVLDTTSVSCSGACDGSASVQVSGGTPGYGITWSNGAVGTTNTGLCGASYWVEIIDANGCDTTITFSLAEPPPLDAVPTQTDVTCGGQCDGTASVAVSGGTPGYSYVWTPAPGGGQGTADATGLCAGPYSVLITDANGCSVTVPFTILDAVPLQFSLNVQDASCPGVCDGEAGVIITGGTPNYTYLWSPAPGAGQGTPNATGLCAGPYQLTVTDALGCDSTIAFTVNAPVAILPNEVVVEPVCSGSCDGSITLAPTGGTGSYTFTWVPQPPNGQGQPQATSLCAGLWSVTIASGGCDTTLTIDLQAPPALDVQLTPTDASCADVCDGAATAAVSGGTPGYTYLWTPSPGSGQGTSNAAGLCAGNYTLLVTDALGCDTTLAITIDAPDPLDVQLATTPASCGGACDGTATATVNGGTPGYTYVWAPAPGGGQGTPNATGLCPGAYTLVVADANGCDTTIAFTISTPSGIQATPQVTPASCADVCDGAIDLVVTGGLAPYTFAWTPVPPVGAGTANVSGLCPGDWTVVISDQAQCDTVLVINVPAPPALNAVLTVTDETCNGPCDGTASVSVSGGQPGYQYTWAPTPGAGQGTPNATGLCAGTYSLTVTDAGGCDTTLTFDILPQQPIDVGLVIVDGICALTCTGSATSTPTGGTGPYTFFWSPAPGTGQGTGSVTGLCDGLYTLTVTDVNGCDTTVTFNVVKPPPIVSSLQWGNETCNGPCTGSAAAFPTGGNGAPYTFLWTPAPGGGQGTNIATGLCAGITYSLTITDALGCDTTESYTILPFQPIVPNLGTTPVSCADACDGTATVGPTGGEAPYTYSWSPAPGAGQGTPQATGLCAGVYTVTISDFFNCDTTVQVLITGPQPLDPGASVSPITCNGQCDGSIVLNVNGGTPGYSFNWTPDPPNGDGTNSAFGLCPGTYVVLVTDANGCDTTATFILDEPLPLTATLATTPSQCQQCIGAAEVEPAGGTPPYSFQWTGQGGVIIGTDSAVVNLCAGLYTVLVSDANGCLFSLPVAITDSDGEVLSTTDGLTSCPGGCDGSVSVQYVCSDPPCTVQWTDALGVDLGQPTDTATNLCAGSYLVQVTNGSGCISIDTAVVASPPPIVANLGTTPETCAGSCDGTATVGPVGGQPPYTFDWTPDPPGGDGGPQATGLCAGSYDLLITDQGGCTLLVSALILAPAPIDPVAVVTPEGCPGSCDAGIVLSPTGGTPGYTYFWQPVPPNGQGTASALDLCPGDWTVTIADLNGCDTTVVFTIAEPTALVLSGSSTPSQCQVCNGTAEVTIAGGTPGYTIQWTDGNGQPAGNAPSIAGLCAGLYTVTVTDAGGCSASLVVPVTDANGEALTVVDGSTTCGNTCDGEVSVQFTCASPPCTVTWTDAQGDTLAQNINVLTGLCAGSYFVAVENGAGCIAIDTALVAPGTSLVPGLSSTPVSCAGACDGTATVGPTGGIGPYTFDWSPDPIAGDGGPQVSGLCAGVYTVQIVDQGTGCDTLVNVLILEPQPLSVTAVVEDASCEALCNGSIVVTVQGGTGPYTYAWSPVPANGDGTNAAFGLCAGSYDLLITDANGCDTLITYTIAEPPPLVLTASATPSECGQCIGAAEVEVTGGTAPYTFAWSLNGAPVGADSVLTNLCAGLYTATVQDANGCLAALLVPITDSNGEVVSTTDGITSCPGECDGEVSASFTCSDPPCTSVWTDALGNDLNEPGPSLDSLCAGPYYIVVTNASGCITIDTATVVEPDPIVAQLSTTPVTCAGLCDGTATVGISGGVGPYTIDWSPDPINGDGTPQVTDLCAGAYDLIITDASGCSITVAVLILEPQPLSVTAVEEPVSCTGACDASIVLTVTGGTPGYSFDWTPDPPNGDGTNAAFDLCAGSYAVLITDLNGCDTTLTFTVVDPPLFEAQLSTTDNLCFGDCAGTATAILSGGVPGYTLTWSDAGGVILAQDTTFIDGLCAGDYTLVALDANGCTITLPFTIGQGTAIDAGLLFTNETCFGPCDGTASVSPTGGAGGFTYLWQPQPGGGQGTPNATGLCPGNWTVTIADSLGCDTTVAFTILPFAPIVPNEVVADVLCNGACDGTITVAPTGGFGNFGFTWTPVPPNGQGTASATGLCPGAWSVTIADGIGCDTTVTFTIQEPSPVQVTVDNIVPASCNTAADGSIAITIGGGVGGYSVLWAGPGGFTSGAEDIVQLLPGPYTVVVTDANGCSASANAQVDALVTVTADAGAGQQVCSGAVVTLDGSASTGASSWQWTDGQGNVVGTQPVLTLTGLAPGSYTYTLTVTDGPCSAQDQVTVEVWTSPFADAGADRTIFLNAQTELGGDPSGPLGSTFSWQPDSLVDDPTAANPLSTPPGTTWFVLTVTTPDGCSAVDSVLVTVVPEVVIPSGFTPNGDGWNDAWQIDLIDMFPECEVEVYSRWGELLFQSVGYTEPWDGRYNGGLVPVGTYYYAIRLNHPDFPEPYTGPLTVIR
ncbi:MAG: gliding motility-associated C-terminal domain-containing protein [Flavobacteriales bacterium]|nr:gliding motility-associated C-terminal domain-containing protein [Flavobacteriales bacterium]